MKMNDGSQPQRHQESTHIYKRRDAVFMLSASSTRQGDRAGDSHEDDSDSAKRSKTMVPVAVYLVSRLVSSRLVSQRRMPCPLHAPASFWLGRVPA